MEMLEMTLTSPLPSLLQGESQTPRSASGRGWVSSFSIPQPPTTTP
jgi:hypothetical protein